MQQRSGGGGWIGWLIFLLVIFGSRFLPPVAQWLSQVTGFSITTPMLIGVLVGLGVLVSIVSSIIQETNKEQPPGTGMPPMPTGQPRRGGANGPTISVPPTSASSPFPTAPHSGLPQAHLPSGGPPRLKPPQFEPIIDPRVLVIGIVGLVLMGGVFVLIVLVAPALP
ncbi:MAG: hypothetical protein EOM24_11030 [Chloroflexia bacterium]|nr:hypothetical protein [Chloroflexia bacterium]